MSHNKTLPSINPMFLSLLKLTKCSNADVVAASEAMLRDLMQKHSMWPILETDQAAAEGDIAESAQQYDLVTKMWNNRITPVLEAAMMPKAKGRGVRT